MCLAFKTCERKNWFVTGSLLTQIKCAGDDSVPKTVIEVSSQLVRPRSVMLRNRCTLTYTDFHILICIYSYIYSEYFQEDIVLLDLIAIRSLEYSVVCLFFPKKKFTCNFPEISFFKNTY